MAEYVITQADANGVRDRVIFVHNDLGETDSGERIEWPGARELVEEHADHYGVRYEITRRALGGLWTQLTEQRKLFPSSSARWCTSDQKTSQGLKLVTRLVKELQRGGLQGRPARVLYCLGLRAQESTGRARKPVLAVDRTDSSKKRTIVRWHPILHWSETDVWQQIADSGLSYHWAYDASMSRLSCSLCVLSSTEDIMCAARLRPALVDDYVRAEKITGHRFKQSLSAREIQEKAHALGPLPPVKPGEAMRRHLGHTAAARYRGRHARQPDRLTNAA